MRKSIVTPNQPRGRTVANAGPLSSGSILLLGLMAPPSYAEDYATRFDPRVETGGLYDDNYRLTPGSDGEVEVAGLVLDARLTTRFRSPTSEFVLTPRVRTRYFPEDSGEGDTAEFLTLDYRSEGETTRLGAVAKCSREEVNSSERPLPDVGDALGNAPGVDTGLADARSTQQLCQIDPRFGFDVNATSRIELSARYLDVSYSRERADTPTDFDSLGGAIEFANDFSARNTLLTRLVASRFDPDDEQGQKSDTYGAQFEWRQRTSTTFEGYLRVGIDRVTTDATSMGAGDTELKSSNYVLGAGLRRDFLTTTLFIDAIRAVAPNSSGVLVTRAQVKVRIRREITPTLAGFASVLGIDDSGAEDDLGFRDRRYAVGTAGLEWRLSRRFTLVGEYGYTRQEYESDPAAKSNRVSMGFIYEPNRLLP